MARHAFDARRGLAAAAAALAVFLTAAAPAAAASHTVVRYDDATTKLTGAPAAGYGWAAWITQTHGRQTLTTLSPKNRVRRTPFLRSLSGGLEVVRTQASAGAPARVLLRVAPCQPPVLPADAARCLPTVVDLAARAMAPEAPWLTTALATSGDEYGSTIDGRQVARVSRVIGPGEVFGPPYDCKVTVSSLEGGSVELPVIRSCEAGRIVTFRDGHVVLSSFVSPYAVGGSADLRVFDFDLTAPAAGWRQLEGADVSVVGSRVEPVLDGTAFIDLRRRWEPGATAPIALPKPLAPRGTTAFAGRGDDLVATIRRSVRRKVGRHQEQVAETRIARVDLP